MRRLKNGWTIVSIAAMILLVRSCQDINCENCETYIVSSSNIIEVCFNCNAGYKLNDKTVCTKDIGLIIGISIGAAAAVVAQIICYIFCKIKYSGINKKKTDVSLEDIYKEKESGKNRGEEENGSVNLEDQFNAYLKHICSLCNKEKSSIKTSCDHYFHHECFKEKVKGTPDVCPKCEKRELNPISMLCCKCLNKIRQISLEDISNYEYFKQYICIACKLKIKRQNQAKSRWRCCC